MLIEYIILIAVVVAGVCGIIITKNLSGNDVINSKIKRKYIEYIADLENSNKRLNGKLGRMKQGVSISKEDFDADNPLGSISELIQQFAPMLPKSVRPFLSDPKLIKFGEKLLAENPEQLKNIISKFVTKGKDGKKDEISDNESLSV